MSCCKSSALYYAGKIVRNLLSKLLLILLLAVMVSCTTYGEQRKDSRLEHIARNFLLNIYNRDSEKILALIPDVGLRDADGLVSKANIVKELKDRDSYLYRRLYEEVTKKQLEECIEDGSLLVSPYAFYKTYGDTYKVDIKHMQHGNVYRVSFFGDEVVKGCKFVLFSINFINTDNKNYIYSYFFNF